jgi:hypothetical protein
MPRVRHVAHKPPSRLSGCHVPWGDPGRITVPPGPLPRPARSASAPRPVRFRAPPGPLPRPARSASAPHPSGHNPAGLIRPASPPQPLPSGGRLRPQPHRCHIVVALTTPLSHRCGSGRTRWPARPAPCASQAHCRLNGQLTPGQALAELPCSTLWGRGCHMPRDPGLIAGAAGPVSAPRPAAGRTAWAPSAPRRPHPRPTAPSAPQTSSACPSRLKVAAATTPMPHRCCPTVPRPR